jgi:hypothetical protein
LANAHFRNKRGKPILIDPALYSRNKSDIWWVIKQRTVPTAFKLYTGFSPIFSLFQLKQAPCKERICIHAPPKPSPVFFILYSLLACELLVIIVSTYLNLFSHVSKLIFKMVFSQHFIYLFFCIIKKTQETDFMYRRQYSLLN